MNDSQFDAMQAVTTCEAEIAKTRKLLSTQRRQLRRARTRLRNAIAADPVEWHSRPNRFAYVDSEIEPAVNE